jgi:hypothetical protein
VIRLLALLSLLAVVTAGCAPEDPQQRAARQAAERFVRDDSAYTGEAHCTDSARTGWFAKRFTEAYVCAARRDGGGCDWLAVRFDPQTRRVSVQLQQRDAGCILPA